MTVQKAYAQPSRSDVHVNRPLTNISIAYIQSRINFVAAQVFPNIPVSKQADAYFEYDRGEFNRDAMRERAPATESAGGTYKIGTEAYYAKVYAYHKDVPDQIRANQDDPIDLDREATEFVTQKGLIHREVTWADSYLKSGVWTFNVEGGDSRSVDFDPKGTTANTLARWSDASSEPIENVRELKRHVLEETGLMPNTLTLGRPVFDVLVDHPDIVGRLDRGQTTGPVMATRDSLAALFEVERVLVMDAIRNTANEGRAPNHSFIAGKHALLSYRPDSPGLLTPSAGYTFGWTGYVGAGDEGVRIKRFRMEWLNADRVEGEMAYDQKLIAKDLGVFFNGIVE